MVVTGLVLLGCSQKYTILKGTSYCNPPKERLRILVVGFKNIDRDGGATSQQMVRQAQEWFETELAQEYVDSSTDVVQSPDAAAPAVERRKARNPFVAVEREQALQRIKAAGIDLERPLDAGGLKALGKLGVTDLVLVGSVGLARLPRLDLVSGETTRVVFGASLTVPVARMGIIVADTKTGSVLLETRKQRRYLENSDPIPVMAQEAMGEILWTGFF
jgi:hypothetical protein